MLADEGAMGGDVLVAYPLYGPAMQRLGEIAAAHKGSGVVSVLCEDAVRRCPTPLAARGPSPLSTDRDRRRRRPPWRPCRPTLECLWTSTSVRAALAAPAAPRRAPGRPWPPLAPMRARRRRAAAQE